MTTMLGPLSSLANKPGVTDIAVTSDGRVWADSGDGMHEDHLECGTLMPHDVRDFAVQLCASLGKRLDDAQPITDAVTSDGIRVHAVLAPIVPQGASLSIRLPDKRLNTLHDLVSARMIPPRWEKFVEQLVLARKSILVCGGTGAGKTTLVRAMLGIIPENERVILVEETRELATSLHANGESLTVRDANVEGAGQITLSDLVKATVRMRPDRIVLGECRGEEVADLLRALNSGHRGSFTTLHADSIERVPARLCALGLLAHIDVAATAMLAAHALDIVIHVVRDKNGRHISSIGRLETDLHGALIGVPLASWDGVNEPRQSVEFERLKEQLSTSLESSCLVSTAHDTELQTDREHVDDYRAEMLESDATIEFSKIL
ncbi:CpaF family protein [Alloscardovia venturai]|uniref:CpaF family protein n=1 Tax=Alloscardovia venturai TaxID=1769421 RepID=A0ABW2Y2U7_9BIFI